MDKVIEFFRKLFSSTIKIGQDNELPFTVGNILLEFVLPVIAAWVLVRLIIAGIKRIIKKSSIKDETGIRVLRWIKLSMRFVLLALIILMAARLFGASLFEYIGVLFRALNTPLVEGGKSSISLITIILAIPIFYLASWMGRLTKRLFSQSPLLDKGIVAAKKYSIINIVRYMVMILVLIVGLSVIGIDISALTVIFGVLGIGIGFGLQSTVANLFSGLVLIFSQPVKENDIILVNGYEARVTQVRIMATILTTITNEIIIVPNSMLINNPIYNFTYNDKEIIIKNSVDVAYSSDLEKVIKVLRGVAEENPYADKRKDAKVRIEEFGSSGIQCLLLTWLKDLNNKYEAKSWTNLEIWRAFKKNNIEIPFTQVDLLIKNSEAGKITGMPKERKKS
ncbi:MAG: mechanosensitive ion channel [Spirochaetales bacterium]|nr:mechanosensitive ion channel [Spirochaetales bacterium]